MHLQSNFKANYDDILLSNEDLKNQNKIKDEMIREANTLKDCKLGNTITYNV